MRTISLSDPWREVFLIFGFVYNNRLFSGNWMIQWPATAMCLQNHHEKDLGGGGDSKETALGKHVSVNKIDSGV